MRHPSLVAKDGATLLLYPRGEARWGDLSRNLRLLGRAFGSSAESEDASQQNIAENRKNG
jgi:hypothetical protein